MSTDTQALVTEQSAEAEVQTNEAAQATADAELGHKALELVQLPDGTVTTKSEVDASIAAGEEQSGPYGGHNQR